MDQFVLSIKKSVLDELLSKTDNLLKNKAPVSALSSLISSYACYVTFEGNPFFDTKLVSKVLLEQANNNYFNGGNFYSMNFKIKKTCYSINCNVYGNEFNYIVRSGK